jgi:thymidylate kinase
LYDKKRRKWSIEYRASEVGGPQEIMFTVALIGADGAGKTTVAKELVRSFPLPIKYLYMGTNPESSNFALPTSRLILFLKLHSYRSHAKQLGITQPDYVSTHHPAHRRDRRGKVGATLRLLNRLAEEWFRQIISWLYQLRRYIVVYDRHFFFDAAPSRIDSRPQKQRRTDAIHYWLLNHLYPKPDLVIFLDVSPKEQVKRKQEVTLDYLHGRREAFLDQGRKLTHFIRVDAGQPVDKVVADVSQVMMQFHETRSTNKTQRKGQN